MEVKREPGFTFHEEKHGIVNSERVLEMENQPQFIPKKKPFKFYNFKEVKAEDMFISASDLAAIKKEMNNTQINTEFLSEEYEITFKREPNVMNYLTEPCNSKQIKKYLSNVKNDACSGSRKRYSCPICKKNFLTFHSRKNHINKHFNQKYCEMCFSCGRLFTLKYEFFNHYLNHSVKKKQKPLASLTNKFICSICSTTFSDITSYNLHTNLHEKERLKHFECKNCLKQFSEKDECDNHLIQCTSFKCKICLINFKDPENFKKHILVNVAEVPYKCGNCFKEFSLKCHQFTKCLPKVTLPKPPTLQTTFKCECCKKVFKNKTSYQSHVYRKRNLNRYKCSICSKGFHYKGYLKIHFRLHTGERPYTCKLCPKIFLSKQTLRVHVIFVHGEKSFCCEICSKGFSRKSFLRAHLRFHDKNLQFKCDLCPKNFVTKYSLKKHKILEHNSGKVYRCKLCSNSYLTKEVWIAHKNRHQSTKELLTCEICSKQFGYLSRLTNHMRCHTREKPFKCELCPKQYKKKGGLEYHMKTRSGHGTE